MQHGHPLSRYRPHSGYRVLHATCVNGVACLLHRNRRWCSCGVQWHNLHDARPIPCGRQHGDAPDRLPNRAHCARRPLVCVWPLPAPVVQRVLTTGLHACRTLARMTPGVQAFVVKARRWGTQCIMGADTYGAFHTAGPMQREPSATVVTCTHTSPALHMQRGCVRTRQRTTPGAAGRATAALCLPTWVTAPSRACAAS
jgi:hypothetical protein